MLDTFFSKNGFACTLCNAFRAWKSIKMQQYASPYQRNADISDVSLRFWGDLRLFANGLPTETPFHENTVIFRTDLE